MKDNILLFCGNCEHFVNNVGCKEAAAPCPIDCTTDASECIRRGYFQLRKK